MPVNDNDIELLDTYLDGELPVDQCEALWRRFSDEPELALELERCRADRTIRQTVFAAMEPSELAAERTEIKIAAARRRHDVMAILSRSVTAVGALAACILFGFTVGWLGHEKYTTTVPGTGSPNQNMQIMDSHPARSSAGTKFVVNIQDELGRVVATKEFDTAEEAHQFADDVSRSQAQRREVHDTPVVPVSDQY